MNARSAVNESRSAGCRVNVRMSVRKRAVASERKKGREHGATAAAASRKGIKIILI